MVRRHLLWSGINRMDGTSLAYDGDAGIGWNSRIVRTLVAGTYTIAVTTYERGETGDFTLTVGGTEHTTTATQSPGERGGRQTVSPRFASPTPGRPRAPPTARARCTSW